MPRPRKATVDPFVDLQRRAEILEREMARTRAAMERLERPDAPQLHSPRRLAAKLEELLSR